MKSFIHLIAIVLILFLSIPVHGQHTSDFQIHFRNRSVTPIPNISELGLKSFTKRSTTPHAKFLIVIQFEEIPNASARKQLLESGIELLDYLPSKAYLASVRNADALLVLQKSNARAIIGLIPEDKIHLGLLTKAASFQEGKGATEQVKVWVNYPTTFTLQEVKNELKSIGLAILSEEHAQYQIVELDLDISQLKALASLNCVKYIQEAPGKMKELNDKNPAYSKSNVLKSNLTGGFNLSGKGVVVGVGDNGDPNEHIDISRQTVNHVGTIGEYHGVFVMGILGGKGIVNEKYEGMAPEAKMIAQNYSKIIFNSKTYVQDYGMVISNNSYGGETYVCSDFGEYNIMSKIVDQQAFESPSLQHVFAAGNSGNINLCNVLPTGYGNVLSGYQSSKNGITVGGVSNTGVLRTNSSRGPVKDGRVKPELVANGTGINSAIPNNKYSTLSGTSMSAPSVSGGLALLYERYRALHAGANPSNALMKAVLVNGASDLGEKGLDYKHGYGAMNLLRSVEMLNHQNHQEQSVGHNATNAHPVVVTPQTAYLKAMLYWNDPASSMMTPVALVNNLDLTVINPAGEVVRPQILNASSVTALSTSGTDDLNNMEQVVIENPVAGTYSIQVAGKSIPIGPQHYVVVFDTVQVGTKLTHPMGNEKFSANDVIQIFWESYGNTTSTFKVEYSLNSGNTWVVMNAALPAVSRQLQWTIPNVATVQAKVRVTQNETGVTQISSNFTILGVPAITLNPIQCEGYIATTWTAVSGATDYEVMMLKGDEMESVAITTATNFNFKGLSPDSTYFVSVRARVNEIAGRRAIAVSRKPADGNCTGEISDRDLSLISIVSPVLTGRKYTSTEFNENNPLTIRIKNLDDAASSETFRVGYAINGNLDNIIWESIAPTIAPNASFDHTFSSTMNMRAVGTYPVKVFIDKENDPVITNNQLSVVFRQLDNVKVPIPYLDDIESFSVQEVRGNYSGVENGRYDFESTTEMGRLRTFAGSDLAASGSKALVLDVHKYHLSGNTNYLTGTYNFEDYNTLHDKILMTFKFKNFGQHQDLNNKVWIRSKDTNPWIEVYDLYLNQNYPSMGYVNTAPIEISKILRQANQQYSASFQVRWGQEGTRVAADSDSGAGYSFDDINFFTATDDIRVVDFVHPVKLSCGLGSQERVQITVRNNASNAISNIPINLQIDGGAVVQEIIASIPAVSSITYTFVNAINISALNSHTLKVWTSLPSDSYSDNDLIEMSFFNSLSVNAFPYFQNFESNADGWISNGQNASWQYGIPTSDEENKAGSGQKIWKTNLSGNYNALEESYLYSPCFDIAGMENPTLSFNMKYDIETCNTEACDFLYLEYSADGNVWKKLGTRGAGVNWYNEENDIWRGDESQRWRVRTISFPSGIQTVRFRFVLKSDEASQKEGVSIDDIHVYDLKHEISANSTSLATDEQQVQGQEWIHFVGTEGILASLKAKNESLGNTIVSSHQHAESVRNVNGQYYLNRSFSIKPTVQPISNVVQVRLYFLDAEAEAIIGSTDCGSCGKPASVYEMFVTKYHNSNTLIEDGVIHNNSMGSWTYLNEDDVTVVPYGKGYFLEFETDNFSEFWLAKGELYYNNALPVNLSLFKAEKRKNAEGATEVLLKWSTELETNFSHFEVEVADNLDALRADKFTKLGTIDGYNKGKASKDYSFIDRVSSSASHRYYRLKMVDLDYTVNYSTLRVVSFEKIRELHIFPNPSSGIFYLNNPEVSITEATVRIYDQGGKLYQVLPAVSIGDGGNYKIDLSGTELTPGLYILEVSMGNEKKVLKAIKK